MAQIADPQKLFLHQLGTVLGMERKIVTMLRKLEGEATRAELKEQLSHHRDETEGQIRNLEQAFRALGQDAAGHRSPTIDGLADEGDQLIEKVSDELVDSVILGGAAETEHLEIAVYRGLIAKAEAMGEEDVVSLLQENLEQEEHTRDEVEKLSERLAQELAAKATA